MVRSLLFMPCLWGRNA